MKTNALKFALAILFVPASVFGQNPDFLHPQQKGFSVNGLSFIEFPVGGAQSGFTDPINIGYPVPGIDQIIAEIKASGTNLVKLTATVGEVKNYNDNTYDPNVPVPEEATYSNLVAFGRKLTAQGIPCVLGPFSDVENVFIGQAVNSHIDPADRRAFMRQHIPRVVTLAQTAESMGCEYFFVFQDDLQHLAADPSLTDLWVQLIAAIRHVFSGRLTFVSSWPGIEGFCSNRCYPQQIMNMVDVFGLGFFPGYTDHVDPTATELLASYQRNVQGLNIQQSITDIHTLYGKPLLVTDFSAGSFTGSNVFGDAVLFNGTPSSQFTVDYPEQTNLFQALFQSIATLDPTWMLGVVPGEFDRLPYEWKDVHLFPWLGSVGASLRGKPVMQTVTQTYQAVHPLTTPAKGWWYSPANPGAFYPIDAENGVVHLGLLQFSAEGDPQWSLARCAQTDTGTYVGTAEQYIGGRALNQAARQPAGIVEGTNIRIVFTSAATATLQIGTQTIAIQRYQFSDQWSLPMLKPTRAGWWDEPTQSGRGYFLEAQGSQLLVGGLIYTASGQPTWFTSTGPVDSNGTFAGKLTTCRAANASQSPVCTVTTDAIQLTFKSPWDATLTLGQEPPVEIRRYRSSEIGWAGPDPSFSLSNPAFPGESTTANATNLSLGVAPGSIATLTGTGLTRGVSGIVRTSNGSLSYSIQGTSVLVNGVPALLMSVQNVKGQEQITFQVPWGVKGIFLPASFGYSGPTITKPLVTVVVVNNGSVSAYRSLFFDVQPALITSDGSHAVAIHSDNSAVTPQNPTHTGETITLYGTGFGLVTPLPPSGTPAGQSPRSTMDNTPVVAINGLNAPVQFAGLSSGSVGQYEIQVTVPDGVGTGDVPALIRIAGETSNVISLSVQGQSGVQSEIIRNGTFSAPSAATWFFYVAQNAVASLDQPSSSGYDGNSSAHITVTAAAVATGGVPAFVGVQLGQFPLPLIQGTLYQFQFWAKSSNARNLRVNMFRQGGGGTFGLSTTYSLDTNWQHHVTYFQATQTIPDGQLSFLLGDQTGEVWLEGVSLQALAPPLPFFSAASRGGASAITVGTAPGVKVGYGVVQPSNGDFTPSGLAIFSFRQNNILVTEAGVPASLPLVSARIHAEINGPVNTGVAIANPSSHSAVVSFYFTDSSGRNFGDGSLIIPGNAQIAKYLSDSPFNGPASFTGTFSFNSSVPVAAIALRGFTNERNEFLITTLPVADPNAATTTSPLFFSHFADGGGWTTQVVLVNPTDNTLAGTVQFRASSGQSTSVNIGGQLNSSFSYSLPARTSSAFVTSGTRESITTGSIRVVPSVGSVAPSGVAIFSFRSAGITVTQAGVPAVAASTAFRLYAESAGDSANVASGLIETGVAITNTSLGAAVVTLQLYKLDGTLAGTGTLSIPSNGQVAAFVNQIPGLASVQSPFQGVLQVSSTALLSVIGLRGRYNERNDFMITTTPSADATAPLSTSPVYFPHLVDGGGYTTQFIVFSVAGESSNIDLLFMNQDGTPITLGLK